MRTRSQRTPPAGFWSLNADMLALVETFVEPKALWALALADQRCRDAVCPRLQALAALRLGERRSLSPGFYSLGPTG